MDAYNVNNTFSHFDLLGSKHDELNRNYQIYQEIFFNHFNYLLNLCGSLFIWKGLPEINGKRYRSSFFEMLLSTQGTCAIAETSKYGMVISPCVTEGLLDFTGNPVRITLHPAYNQTMYATLDIELDANKDKFVYCRNDNIGCGFMPLIEQTAELLTQSFMSMTANISQQKFPIIIKTMRNMKLSTNIITNKIDSWENYIVLDGDTDLLNDETFKIANKEMPYVADKIYGNYMDVLNNFYMRIGINTIPYNKKERLITDEVNANNQAISTASDVFDIQRQEICREYNNLFADKYGELSVSRNMDISESLVKKEVDSNEPVHDRAEVS